MKMMLEDELQAMKKLDGRNKEFCQSLRHLSQSIVEAVSTRNTMEGRGQEKTLNFFIVTRKVT
jgi:hypothetical protein